jgi:hypothetical protein
MLRNEQGFSKILVIAGILLLLGLGFIAFTLRGKKSNTTSNQSTTSTFAIKEWNVEFPMAEGHRDLYYTLVTYQGIVGQGAKIYSKDIDAMRSSSGKPCKNDAYPLFVISRVSAIRGEQMNNPNSPDYDPAGGPFKVYNFEKDYAFGGAHDDKIMAPCAKGDEKVAKRYREKIQAIRQGYSHLKATPKPTQ